MDITTGNNTVTFTQGIPAVTTTARGFNAEPGLRPGHQRRKVDAKHFVDELAGK